MAKYTVTSSELTSIADAIREKNGNDSLMAFPDGFLSAIRDIPVNKIIEEKDVNFLDYDGTILYSYTLEEANGLENLPDGGTHDGLIFQGWNWTLLDIKEYLASVPNGVIYVGALYIPSDNGTHIYISIPSEIPASRRKISLTFTQSLFYGSSVDWGDGSVEMFMDSGSVFAYHTYQESGKYVISIHASDGCNISFPGVSSGYTLLGSLTSANRSTFSWVDKIEIGHGVNAIGANAFRYFTKLKTITINNGVETIGESAFSSCTNLRSVVIPYGVTIIDKEAFRGCVGLLKVSLPNSIETIGASAFTSCEVLEAITIPASVINVYGMAFYQCFSLRSIAFSSNTTTILSQALDYCYSLNSATLPTGLTKIGDSVFYHNYSLTKITIPDTVTSIGFSAFGYCYGLLECHLLSTTPPSLADGNVFLNTPSDIRFYVPYSEDHSILLAYKVKTNWSSLASKIREEPQ